MLNIIHNSQLLKSNVEEAIIENEVGIDIADSMTSSLRDDLARVDKMVKEYEQITKTKVLKDRFAKASTFAYQMFHLVRECIIYNEYTGTGSVAYTVWDRFAERINGTAELGISSKIDLKNLGENIYRLEREMKDLAAAF